MTCRRNMPAISLQNSSVPGCTIQHKKHESYDIPPAKTFFGRGKGKHLKDTPSVRISPGKRINLCTECINQLDKWHDLMEVISEEYEEPRELILPDIKQPHPTHLSKLKICRVEFCTELFYAIIPTLFLFLLICYPYILLHF